ncbi:MAG: nucleoside hydrolase [Lentisphaeria bacterium]|nr:nucleoside hydrolase [Lentisphaeria bacterium]
MKTVPLALAAATAPLGGRAHPIVTDTFGLRRQGRRIPVVFDTDLGGDIDDTWALLMLLQCPELDVRLVAADSGNATYRARLAAKMLEACGRTDVPVAVGIPDGDRPGHQSAWLGSYRLEDYPGRVYPNGVDAIVRAIRESADPVTVVCVGAVPNIAAALERAPDIVENARFVGMHGSVRKGYNGKAQPDPEANVRTDPGALAKVLAAPWECTITPLDTCGIVVLRDAKYQAVYTCDRPGVRMLMDNYRLWAPSWLEGRVPNYRERSTTLFDTVAVYMAFSEDLLVMEDLRLRVTDAGHTVEDPQGNPVRCAMAWRDLAAFEDLLVQRICGSP